MRNDQDSQLSAKFLQVICQLHEWESQHLDVASTQAGRYLYLNLARQLQDTQGGPSAFLKGIYYNKDLSERALRYKIREFENDGLIERGQLNMKSSFAVLYGWYKRQVWKKKEYN